MWNVAHIEVLITVELKPKQIQSLERISPRFGIRFHQPGNNKDISDEQWAKTDILITGTTPIPLSKAVNLKWLQLTTHLGYGDTLALQIERPDLMITTLEGISSTRIAQHIFAMMLNLGLGYLPEQESLPVKKENTFSQQDIYNSTVGIIDYGSTGQELARILQPFKPIILAATQDAMKPVRLLYSPSGYGDPTGIYFDRLYPMQALGSLVKICDFLIITDTNSLDIQKLITPALLKEMKSSSRIIDVSQQFGDHVSTIAKAVKTRQIHSAALTPINSNISKIKGGDLEHPYLLLTQTKENKTSSSEQHLVELLSLNLTRYLKQDDLLNQFSGNF